MIGNQSLLILTDIIGTDVPLLLLKVPMKQCNMKIDFENDTVKVFGEVIPLLTTSSRLYALPITKSKYLIDNIGNEGHGQITLKVVSSKNNRDSRKITSATCSSNLLKSFSR